MRVGTRLGVALVAAAAGLTGSALAGVSGATGATGDTGARPVAHPPTQQTLGVDALSPSDVWVVGDQTCQGVPSSDLPGRRPPRCTYLQHFDGTSWTEVPGQNPGTVGNSLVSVSGDAADDVWAVGYEGDTIHRTTWLVEHWNGTAWTVVATPDEPGRLTSVVEIAPNDVWANSWGSKLAHWNGSTWTVEQAHGLPRGGSLSAISASGAGNVFAVGQHRNTLGTHPQLFAVHFNGSRLAVSPTAPSPDDQWLSGVDVTAPGSAWAVGLDGESDTTPPPPADPLIEHWDGTAWTRVTAADPPNGGRLAAVDDASNSDIWAVGSMETPAAPLIEHWDGTTWSIVAAPALNGAFRLDSVSADASNDAWAVGDDAEAEVPLVLHWDGTSWTVSALG